MKLNIAIMALAAFGATAAVAGDNEALTPSQTAEIISVYATDFEPKEMDNEALTAERMATIYAAFDEVLSDGDTSVVLANR